MEMPIMILERQQAPVTNPAGNGKTANTKQADAGQESFKSTFNKAMDETEKGKMASAQGESESVQGEEKTSDEPCAANMLFIAVPPVLSQPAIEAPTDAVPADAVVTVNTMPDMGNGESMQPEMLVISQSETPVIVAPVSVEPDPANLAEILKVQNGTQAAGFAPVQTNTPPVEIAPETVPAMMGQEEIAPVQNAQPMPVEMTGKPVVTIPAGPKTAPDGKAPDNPVDTELNTQPLVTAAVVTEAPKEEIKSMPLKADEQPAEKKGTVSKEVLTSIAVPVVQAEETQSSANTFLNDTADNPPEMTSAGAMPSAKAETVSVPFPKVETPQPIKEQVFREIVQKARYMSHGTQQEIQIQLKPENLGLLNVQIAVENGAVTAKFQTDNPQVKQALEASFNQLKQDLQTQGLKVQDVEVSLAQQGMSFSQFSHQAPQFSLIKSRRIVQGEDDMAEQSPARVSLIENYGGLHSGGVDYRI